jgi:hypothetical protein
MVAMKKPKAPKPPKPAKPKAMPKLKAKTGTVAMKEVDKLDLGQKYIAAQAASPAGAQIVPEVTALKAARQTVLTKDQEYADIKAMLDEKFIERTAAALVHNGAIDDYAYKAAKVANGDIAVLTSLGVDGAATKRVRRVAGPADIVTDLRLDEGLTTGTSMMKWTRPVGAAAFIAQYKLELPPPAPGAPPVPPAEWLPAEGFATKSVEWTIDGLPPAAQIRARIRAIGAQIGPWSDEVLGKAR